jgi:hypothetical protein
MTTTDDEKMPDWNLFNPEIAGKVEVFHNFFGKCPKKRVQTALHLMYNPGREAEAFALFEHLNGEKKRGSIIGPSMVVERLNNIMGNDGRALTESTEQERAELKARLAWPLRTPGRVSRRSASPLWTKTNAQFKGHVQRTLYRLYYLHYRAERKPAPQAHDLATRASKPPVIADIPAPATAQFAADRTLRTNISLDDEDVASMLRVAQAGQLGRDLHETILARWIKTLEVLNGSRPLHARMCPITGIDWKEEKVSVYEPRPNRPVGDDGRLNFRGGSDALRAVLDIHPAILHPVPPGKMVGPPPMILFSPKAARMGLYAPMEMPEYTDLSAAPADVLNIPDYSPYQHRRTFASAMGANLVSLDNISLGLGHTGRKVVLRYLDFSKPKRAHVAHEKMEYLVVLKRKQLEAAA